MPNALCCSVLPSVLQISSQEEMAKNAFAHCWICGLPQSAKHCEKHLSEHQDILGQVQMLIAEAL
jgi:hypothetical protein